MQRHCVRSCHIRYTSIRLFCKTKFETWINKNVGNGGCSRDSLKIKQGTNIKFEEDRGCATR